MIWTPVKDSCVKSIGKDHVLNPSVTNWPWWELYIFEGLST